MPSLILSQVRKKYPNGAVGLHPCDLAVADGELLVLVGPSGSGKSTLLRLIAGLEFPDGGEITLDGRRVESWPPHRREVGFVAQRPALYPHLTVADNLAVGLRLASRSRPRNERPAESEITSRVTEAAQLLQIDGLLSRYPNELSGGEQRRVALGRLLVRRPGLWLLDEPFSQLDAALRNELRGELHLLQRRLRATMIIVSHDPIDALAFGQRIGVLGRGRLQQVGDAAAVYARPGNRFVAHCLGWPPVNLIDGQSDGCGRFAATDAGLALPLPEWAAPGSGDDSRRTLGVRPEDLHPAAEANESEARLGGWEALLAERVGGAWLVTFRRQACRLLCWWVGRPPPELNTLVELAVPLDRLLWFAADGRALRGPDSRARDTLT